MKKFIRFSADVKMCSWLRLNTNWIDTTRVTLSMIIGTYEIFRSDARCVEKSIEIEEADEIA